MGKRCLPSYNLSALAGGANLGANRSIMTLDQTVAIDGTNLSLRKVAAISCDGAKVALAPHCRPRMKAARDLVEKTVASGERIYGVTTGFGRLKNVMIPTEDAVALQRNLVRSHASGVGEPLPIDATRASVLLRAHSLARGNSGVRIEIVELLIEMLNRSVTPVIP